MLLLFVCINGANTRSACIILNKPEPIGDIWIMILDEQLFSYHGRSRFTQYIPSKRAKYGMKIWWVCVFSTNYPLKGQTYRGKLPNDERQFNQCERVKLNLMEKFVNREVKVIVTTFSYSSNWQTLMQIGFAIVGNVHKYKFCSSMHSAGQKD